MSRKPIRKGIIVDLFNDQGGFCCYCQKPMTLRLNRPKTATVEHIIPRSKGGADKPFNYAAACRPCNEKKSNTDLLIFLLNNPRIAI